MRELDFVRAVPARHPKQFELATRVAELTPGDLNRIFFTNSGSEAVDTAMKVALAYHQARGQSGRNVFVSRERAYHGVNFGGVALSGLVNNRRKFGPGLPGIAHMRHTHLKENFFTPGEGAHGVELAEDLARLVNLYGAENIAACFVEPIAGSTGCLVPPKGYLKRLREICDAHGILLVFDEVICGFGRTGQAFAAQSFGVTPGHHDDGEGPHQRRAADGRGRDFASASTTRSWPRRPKARSSSSTATRTRAIRVRAPRASPRSTSTGTRACSSAAASCRRISSTRSSRCKDVAGRRRHPRLRDVRGRSTCIRPARREGAARCFQKKLFDNGLHLKTTGDSAIIAPPLIAEKSHIDMIADILRKTLARSRFLYQPPAPESAAGFVRHAPGGAMKTTCSLAAVLALAASLPAWAQKTVTFAYQDMMNPFRWVQQTGEIEKATGYKINWRQFGGGGDVIRAMASGDVAHRRSRLHRRSPRRSARAWTSSSSGSSRTSRRPKRSSRATAAASTRSPTSRARRSRRRSCRRRTSSCSTR